MTTQLFPKPPRQMKQPRKAVLRQRIADLTEERDQLRAELAAKNNSTPWWRSLIKRTSR